LVLFVIDLADFVVVVSGLVVVVVAVEDVGGIDG